MRRRIRSAVLKERFEKAWRILPDPERRRLRSFIRYVDETRTLDGTFIYARSGPGRGDVEIVKVLEGYGSGFTAFLSLPSGDVADVILPADPLAVCDEAPALLIILHELVHALDYLDRPEEASARSESRSEAYCWAQAMVWASLSTSLGNEESEAIVRYGRVAMREDEIRGLLE